MRQLDYETIGRDEDVEPSLSRGYRRRRARRVLLSGVVVPAIMLFLGAIAAIIIQPNGLGGGLLMLAVLLPSLAYGVLAVLIGGITLWALRD